MNPKQKEKILILGAGIYQVPLIKKARELGYYVIVVSINGNYPGFAFADKIYYENTRDEEKILEIAQSEGVEGIVTGGTDVALRSVGKVVDALKLKGPSSESTTLTCDKMLMKKALINGGVRTPKYIEAKNLDDCHLAFDQLALPIIFKAVDSSGSRGIVKVTDRAEINGAYKEVMEVTNKDYFIIEEFIEGVEFGAQSFVLNGKQLFTMAHGDMLYKGKITVPIGHYVPYDLDHKAERDMELQLSLSIKALGIDNTAINADFIMRDGQVYVLEIGARSGATCLPELVSIHYQFDYYAFIIQTAMNKNGSFTILDKKPCAAELMISEKEGVLDKVESDIRNHQEIVDFSIDYQQGEYIPKFRVGPDRIGQIIVKGETLDSTLEFLNEVKNNVRIELKQIK
ncbi:ATP-grasp domain-containing protein [Fulvivirgaceae bacterium BMA10]|uniref:ATP-grasp domain-containing protein n=1 Tax=Splendidivirga corallicola TaxID=3051826 RepID=A0ABT8KX92_9BACT|nr:ATP-grasp domain-containing protein [Fulvivirgaceae bacterium BMA10]